MKSKNNFPSPFFNLGAFCVLMILTASCIKIIVGCAGTVYSKHGVLTPGVTVRFNYSRGGKSQVVGSVSTITDAAGRFQIKVPHNTTVEYISLSHSDSGKVTLYSYPRLSQTMVLHLE